MSSTDLTLTLHPATERGLTDIGWLRSHHTFSFGEYYDPARMGFHSLRVINDDLVAPGNGFGTHSHRNMEIFSYVVHGALEHKDSLGHGRVIEAGQFQYMSAGDGIMHSEFNPSERETTRFLQIWITPSSTGGTPRYQDISLKKNAANTLTRIAAPDGGSAPILIRQNASIDFGRFEANQALALPHSPERPASWLQLISGQLQCDGLMINPGDGVAFTELPRTLKTTEASIFLLFGLA